MSTAKNNQQEIRDLAKSLIEGDRKSSLSVVRQRLNKPFNNNYDELVWKGWERALSRQESGSLIIQLLAGLNSNEANDAFHDLRKKKTEILIRDHTQKDLSKEYLATWVTLLEAYCDLIK